MRMISLNILSKAWFFFTPLIIFWGAFSASEITSQNGSGQEVAATSPTSEPLAIPQGEWIEDTSISNIVINSCNFNSAGDGWAVGYGESSIIGPGYGIFNWDGKKWDTIPVPRPDSVLKSPYTVRTLSSTNVWVVGSDGYIIHWDGNRWKDFSIDTEIDLEGLSFFSADFGFVSGGQIYNQPFDRQMFKWNGKQWGKVYVPQLEIPYVNPSIHAIQMVTEKDGWAGSVYHLYRWNGTIWTTYNLQKELGKEINNISSFSKLGPSDIWATGSISNNKENKEDGIIIHWNGNNWEQIYESPYLLDSIWMLSSTQGWAVGELPSYLKSEDQLNGVILYWDGFKWSEIPQELQIKTVCGYDQKHIWAFGHETVRSKDGYTHTNTIVFRLTQKSAPTIIETSTPTIKLAFTTTPTIKKTNVDVTPSATPTSIKKLDNPRSFQLLTFQSWQIGIIFGIVIIIFLFYFLRQRR